MRPSRLPAGRPLRARERVLLAAEIVGAYVRARRAMREQPIAATVATLRRGERRMPARGASLARVSIAAEAADGVAEARRLGRAVARILAPLPGDTRCLVRSLVLTRLLAQRGIDAKLVIGAHTTPGFLAHAWVEHAGAPVLDPGDGSFARLVEL